MDQPTLSMEKGSGRDGKGEASLPRLIEWRYLGPNPLVRFGVRHTISLLQILRELSEIPAKEVHHRGGKFAARKGKETEERLAVAPSAGTSEVLDKDHTPVSLR